MPQKNRYDVNYEVNHEKYKTFEAAAARAVDLSLQQESQPVTITEYGQLGTFHITVTAQAEPA